MPRSTVRNEDPLHRMYDAVAKRKPSLHSTFQIFRSNMLGKTDCIVQDHDRQID
jgi:hypothetical protein